MTDDPLTINETQFGDSGQIDSRIEAVSESDRDTLRSTLQYLYLDDGPSDLPRARLRAAEQHLESAERIVVRWLSTRTNGRLRKHFGPKAVVAARAARYRCQSCHFADVRVLNLYNVGGRSAESSEFECLCANCHAIKSRPNDWSLPTDK